MNEAAPVKVFSFILLGACAFGCSDQRGTHEFIPATNYHAVVTLSIPKEGVVGEWIPLKASVTNGPWIRVPVEQIPEGVMGYATQPPTSQQQIAASMTWFTEPSGFARFDVATLAKAQTNPWDREVIFSEPGVYKIWGLSAYPTECTSNVETITIRVKGNTK